MVNPAFAVTGAAVVVCLVAFASLWLTALYLTGGQSTTNDLAAVTTCVATTAGTAIVLFGAAAEAA